MWMPNFKNETRVSKSRPQGINTLALNPLRQIGW